MSGATGLTLSRAAGTGTLGGTLNGTIGSGQSQVTVAGVTYTKAESGVQLAATEQSGDSLAAGTSTPFTVSSLSDRLVITSVASGADPIAGSTFDVVVQVQDAFGNPGNVAAATPILLSRNAGTGTLGGTLTGTISAGQNQVTISGATYTKAESGVQLGAARTGGDNLVAAVSSPFTVDPGAASAFVVTGSPSQTAGTRIN